MKIQTKLEFKEYLRLLFILTYKRPIVIIVTLLGVAIIAMSLLYFTNIILPNSFEHIIQLILGIFIITYLPFSVWLGAKRTFKTHKLIQETIIYDFQENNVTITGETFNSEIELDKLYRILELKDWFLLYHNNRLMNIVTKPQDSVEIEKLRSILNKVNVKKKLK